MSSKIEMSLDEMEIFFQQSLANVKSRPKRFRKDSRPIRSGQRHKITRITTEINDGNFEFVKKFFSSILTIGSDDEGTPV